MATPILRRKALFFCRYVPSGDRIKVVAGDEQGVVHLVTRPGSTAEQVHRDIRAALVIDSIEHEDGNFYEPTDGYASWRAQIGAS